MRGEKGRREGVPIIDKKSRSESREGMVLETITFVSLKSLFCFFVYSTMKFQTRTISWGLRTMPERISFSWIFRRNLGLSLNTHYNYSLTITYSIYYYLTTS